MASYESAIPYIQKAEGGLSRATTDTASKSPSPFEHNGKTGWHTNRGITWDTFKGLSSKAGYTVNKDNFIFMPDNIWLKIYRVGFWDSARGDLYNSQAIANAVVDWAWASGTGQRGSKGALIRYLAKKGITATNFDSIANGFNELVKKEGEQKVFNDLIDERKRFFVSLKQPANEKGWLARMETLRQQGMSLFGQGVKATYETVKKHPYITVAVVAGMGIALFVLLKTLKQSK